MQPQPRNIAARIGRWSARHRRAAIVGWLVFVVLAVVAGSMATTRTLDPAQTGVGESGHAQRAVFDAFPQKADEGVLIQSSSERAGSPQFRAVVRDVMQRLDRTAGVQRLTGPYADGGARVSADEHSALVSYELPGDGAAAKASIKAPIAAVADAAAAHPGFKIDAFGSASSERNVFVKLGASSRVEVARAIERARSSV